MVRLLLRVPVLRALYPRVAQPILPLARLPTSPPRTSSTRLFHHSPARLSSPPPSPGSDLPPNASLSQRLKHLIKTYGWYALGVYAFLSAADFTVAFAGINLLGAEHVARVTEAAKDYLSSFIHSRPPEPGQENMDAVHARHPGAGGQESLYAMLVLAYTVHKTLFLPVRVGLTATLTPRIVRWLSARGWAGSAGTKRAAQEMRDRMRNARGKE